MLAKDDAALEANTALLSENSNALRANSLASAGSGRSAKSKSKQIAEEGYWVERQTKKVKDSIKAWFSFDGVTNKVGYNIMGFSFRIGMWFVPAMALMATSMLPVIAGLLAMASAAILAGGALVGVFALGALMQMRQTGSGGSGGYGGARRPYESSMSSGYARVSTVFEPIWKVLESPKLKSQMDNVKWFFESTIGAFAHGLGDMLTTIDSGMLKTLENMFVTWLPNGMRQFAQWGNAMMRLIGAGTIKRLGDLVNWIARGLLGAAVWLESGGWKYIDQITSTMNGLISTLTDLGKSVLPIFAATLSAIYPQPIRPILLMMTALFNAIGSNPIIMETFVALLQLIMIFVAYKAVLFVVVALLGSAEFLILTIVGILILLFKLWEAEIAAFAVKLLSIWAYLITQIGKWLMELDNIVHPGKWDDRLKGIDKNWTFEKAWNGEYASDWAKEWAKREAAEGNAEARAKQLIGIDMTIRGNREDVERLIVDGIGEKTGTSVTPSSNLRTTQRVIL